MKRKMLLEKAIEVLEEWERVSRHYADGSDEDSEELNQALNTVLPILKVNLQTEKGEKKEHGS